MRAEGVVSSFPPEARGPTILTVPTDPSSPIPTHKPGATAGSGHRRIPEATVARLPVYQRILEELLRSGTATVSSELLASAAQVNAAKVRKDLSLLGSFGTRGAGYDAAFLIEQIDRQLGLDRMWTLVIAGIGNLGRALARSQGFAARNFDVTALLDIDPTIIGQRVDDVVVRHLDDLPLIAAEAPLAIGVITTPASVAQRVADMMVGAGVRSILNFAPQVLEVPPDILLRYVDLSIELQVMSFYQSRLDDASGNNRMPVIRSIGLTSSSSE
jgi:redox-sensing transcriptional repressor